MLKSGANWRKHGVSEGVTEIILELGLEGVFTEKIILELGLEGYVVLSMYVVLLCM